MTAGQIAAIPIEYNGIRYRSALEADWAATFTHLRMYFEYEPQPWRMPSGAVYDCDFYLPNHRTYAEAKGPHNERLWKPREFATVLAATEFPRAFQVIVLRPAGPNGLACWESAIEETAAPLLSLCAGCGYWGFTDDDDDGGAYCRQCYSHAVLDHAHYPAGDGIEATYGLEMKRAPRPWAVT